MSEAEELLTPRVAMDPGWYPDLSNEDYHSGTLGYSSSQLKVLVEHTPAHLIAGMGKPKESSSALHVGSAFHTKVLEPHRMDLDVVIEPAWNNRVKSQREAREAFHVEHSGKAIITEAQLDKVNAMAESVHKHPIASLLVQDILVEQSVYWWYRSMDPDDDLRYQSMMKVRPDALCRAYPVIVDLKSCRDASYSGFIRAVQQYYYHLSAAMYLEGVNQCKELLQEMGHFAFNKFVFICVESEPPYLTAVYELSPEYLQLGKQIYRRAVYALRQGQQNDWPGFPDDIRVLEPPPWALRGHIV